MVKKQTECAMCSEPIVVGSQRYSYNNGFLICGSCSTTINDLEKATDYRKEILTEARLLKMEKQLEKILKLIELMVKQPSLHTIPRRQKEIK